MDSTRTAKTEEEPEHDDDEEQALNRQWAWDDVTGAELDPKTVAEEREKAAVAQYEIPMNIVFDWLAQEAGWPKKHFDSRLIDRTF